MIEFRVSCIPPKTSHHAKRIVKRGKFSSLADKPELVAAKQTLESLLLPHQVAEPVRGAVCLQLEFTWPWLASHPKKTRTLGRIPHTSRPDCSNLAKTLEDRLVALRFIEDDNAVVRLMVLKFWGNEPGIRVSIASVGEAASEKFAAAFFGRGGPLEPHEKESLFNQEIQPSLHDA